MRGTWVKPSKDWCFCSCHKSPLTEIVPAVLQLVHPPPPSFLPSSPFKPPSWNTSLLINYWIKQPSIKTAHGWRWILEHGLVRSMHCLAHFCLARWAPHLLLFEGELPGIRVFLLTFVSAIPLLPVFSQSFLLSTKITWSTSEMDTKAKEI